MIPRGGHVMNKKVLVVDDDPDVRLFSATVLEEHGYIPHALDISMFFPSCSECAAL